MDLTKAKIWFVTLCMATFVLFAISAMQDQDREWKKYQKEFYAMEQDRGVNRDYSVGIKQIWNPSLGRTDRCITCHVGMEDLDVKNPYTQNPYKGHPKLDMMAKHPTSKLGCTICHEGQGQATTVEAAHGWVHHWDWPMHKQRGGVSFIQASCTKCHTPDQLPEGTEQLVAGRALWDKYGCVGCHMVQVIQPDGGNQCPELTGMGTKTESQFSNTHKFHAVEKVDHYEYTTKYQWLYQHFLNPQKITPDDPHTPENDQTVMPNFQLSDAEAKLLTLFVSSFRDPAVENIPSQWMAKSAGKYSIVKTAPKK
jgi:hypothetical protein